MKGLFERAGTAKSAGTSSSTHPKIKRASSSKSDSKLSPKASSLSGLFVNALSIFDTHQEACCQEKKPTCSRNNNGWAATVKRVMASGSMRRFKEHMLGFNKSSSITSTSDIWLLGVCYKVSSDDSLGGDPVSSNGFAAFVDDLASRILMTYRKGFEPIGDSKYTSDVGWGCMLRSSQMLVAEALAVHRLGRSWRRSMNEEIDQDYIEMLHQFGDSDESAFSIHRLLQAGQSYGLAAGSWVGPYAMCRAWEMLARGIKGETDTLLPIALYIVSGDEDGERGGAPVVCVEDVSRRCLQHSGGQAEWTAVLLLVPLVLGLEKVNPRYVPSLGATFTFPQSLGILGGKPGASTYIVGVQDEKAFYLDPHEVQPVVNIKKDDLDADSSSYHSNVVRHIPLDSIDPSLAIGFYCRDKDDFDDFCDRASKLANESNGAPLFTVARIRSPMKPDSEIDAGEADDSYDMVDDGAAHEDDWQLL